MFTKILTPAGLDIASRQLFSRVVRVVRVVFVGLLPGCSPLSAQITFTNLHNFSWNSSDGTYPRGGLTYSAGTLYGTTESGANGGCVYQINTDRSGFNVVYSVGGEPLGGVTLAGDTLYGTTYAGGDNGSGSVFSVNTNGGNFTVLHSFASGAEPSYEAGYQTNVDGIMPFSGLVYADGAL